MNKFNYINQLHYQTLIVRTVISVAVFIIFMCFMSNPTLAEDEDNAEDEDKTEETFTSTSIHAGEIVSLTTTTESVKWLDLETLMLDSNLEQGASTGSAETERAPDDDKLFIIITVELAEGRSIGKYDYNLKVKGDVVECEGMARGEDAAFDPRSWQEEFDQDRESVKLLYEAPRFNSEAIVDLVPALDTTIEKKEHELTIKPTPELADENG